MSTSACTFVTNLANVEIPKNIEEAWKILKWKQAVKKEIQALEKNSTWDIMEKPEGKTLVRHKWVFTIKYNSNGMIECLIKENLPQVHGVKF